MGIVITNGGALTTVQDRGRMGYQRYGFHVSGAMDKRSYEIANALVGNDSHEAVLEYAVVGPEIVFKSDTVVAITGADFAPRLNDEDVDMYKAIQVHKGDVLKFAFAKDGVWGYVSFAGGLDVPMVMGSRSTDMKSELGGYEGRKLQAGDEIGFVRNVQSLYGMDKRVYKKPTFKAAVTKIRVVLGPQDDCFSRKGLDTFLGTEYEITNACDRMGYRLDGEPIEHNERGADIISDGIAYGSIQVPSQGLPIILLSDRQTTGGYTKIATVIGHDIPKLVQRRPGEKVVFKAITPQEAQQFYVTDFADFEEIKKHISPVQPKPAGFIGFLKNLFSK